jgi:hypothetical protein
MANGHNPHGAVLLYTFRLHSGDEERMPRRKRYGVNAPVRTLTRHHPQSIGRMLARSDLDPSRLPTHQDRRASQWKPQPASPGANVGGSLSVVKVLGTACAAPHLYPPGVDVSTARTLLTGRKLPSAREEPARFPSSISFLRTNFRPAQKCAQRNPKRELDKYSLTGMFDSVLITS